MQMFKSFFFTLAGLFIIITLISLLIPSEVRVERGVVVNGSARKVFAEVRNLRNWAHWQPVFRDGAARLNFSADSTGINSFVEWERNGNRNKFMVTGLHENQITVSLIRKGENDVINTISVLPLPDTNTVQVGWKALTRLKWYPWEKFSGIFIEKLTGQGYEDALNGLKGYVESH
jgi:hypothetical protein